MFNAGMVLPYVGYQGLIVDLAVGLGDDPRLRLGKLGQVVYLRSPVTGDEENRSRACLLQGEKGNDELVPVRKLKQHEISLPYPKRDKARGQPIHAISQLPVRKPPRIVHQGFSVRVGVRGLVKEVSR